MKRIIKYLSVIICFIFVCFTFSITIFAWDPPKVNTYVKEEVEFRAVWVCTVSNMDVDPQIGTDEKAINEWKNKYLDILANSKAMGMNAIIFQVRPNNDAFYPSKYNPWSEFLAGYGVDPGWDPLEWMIDVTHKAGLEYHAWLNPYRTSVSALSYHPYKTDQATSSTYWYDYDEGECYDYKVNYFKELADTLRRNNTVVDNPIMYEGATLDHEIVYGSESKFVLNPASSKTIEHLNNTIDELIENYDIDGIHFDDYFYPDDSNYKGSNTSYKGHTFSSEPKYDISDYNDYKAKGGTLDLYNWRRENVNKLIKTLSNTIRENNKTDDYNCAFGISPAARWAPSIESCPAGSPRGAEGGETGSCNNYYSYSDLYADTRKWVLEDWIDYILPQDYTYLGSAVAGTPTGNYGPIVAWWSNQVVGTKCKLYIGTPAYQISTWDANGNATVSELFYQIRYCQSKNYNTSGFVMFRYESLIVGKGKTAMDMVSKYLWPMAALTPIYDTYTYTKVKNKATIKKLEKIDDNNYTLTYNLVDDAKAYAITEDDVVIKRVLASDNQMKFTTKENKTYKLITYSKDNTIFEESELIDLSTAKVNEAPVVTVNELEKEYLVNTDFEVEFKVSDVDQDNMTYKINLYRGNKKYMFDEGDVENGVVKFTYHTDSFAYNNLRLEIVVNDGHNSTTITTTSFNIVTSLTPVNPDPIEPDPIEPDPIEPDPVKPEPTPADAMPSENNNKKKCGKKSLDLFISMMSMSSLLYIIIRKKK